MAQSGNTTDYQRDTALINNYIQISKDILYFYPDSASDLLDKVTTLSSSINYDFGMYSAHNLRGALKWYGGDMNSALEEYKQALNYANDKKNIDRKAKVYGNIALVFSQQFEVDSSIKYLNESIRFSKENNLTESYLKGLFDLGVCYLGQDNYIEASRNFILVKNELEKHEDSVLRLYLYNNLGTLYTNLGNFDSALQYYNMSIDLDKQVPSINNQAGVYINIGELYFRHHNQFDSAMHYYAKALDHALPAYRNMVEIKTNINVGNVYLEQLQFDSAKKYYENALADPIIDQLPMPKTAVLVNLGIYYSEHGNRTLAKSYLDSGCTLAEEFGMLKYQKNALQSLYKLDSVNGDFESCLKHYQEYHQISDALLQHDAQYEMAILEFEKFVDREKQNNQLLKDENEVISKRMWLSVVIIAILAVLLYALYLSYRKRKKLHHQLSENHTSLLQLNDELKAANEQLSAQQQELQTLNTSKDKLFSVLGHDLKSPFNGIIGILGLVRENWDIMNDSEKKEMLDMMYSSSKRVSDLLNNILHWGKTQEGLVSIKYEKINLKAALDELTELYKAPLSQKEIDLSLQLPNDGIFIDNDSMLFSRIVQNLVNNAIKFTPKGGNIKISVKEHSDQITLSVIDSGIGIPKDKIDTIFDMYLSFRRPGTDGEQSTGMGLLLSQEYAKLMGAKIDVQSIEGQGSTFTLSFPR